MSLHEKLNQAAQLHQRGDIDQAESEYAAILRSQPGQPDALHLLGVIALQKNEFGKAIGYIEKAVTREPNQPLYHENLGKAYFANCQYSQAVNHFETSLSAANSCADVYPFIALAHERNHRLEDALECCERWSQHPGLPPSDQAEACYCKANLLRKLKNDQRAEQAYRQVIALAPTHEKAHNNLGNLLQDAGRCDEAIASYHSAIALNKNSPEVYNNLGTALKQIEQWDAAEAAYRRAIQLAPNSAEFYFNLANLFRAQNQYRPALFQYDQALSHNSQHIQAGVNRAATLKELKQLDAALAGYDAVLEAHPNVAEAHFNRSLIWLMLEKWDIGWDEHEWRLQNEPQPQILELPVWRGPGTKSYDRLLIRAEQGIGDEIMFASCLPDVVNHVGQCTVECDPRLIPIFKRSFPELEFIDRHQKRTAEALRRFDSQIFLGSLPQSFRRERSAFPRRANYLSPDATAVEHWKGRYSALPNQNRPVVGISWKGGHKVETRRKRTIHLDNWLSMLENSPVRFVNLQYGETEADVTRTKSKTGTIIHSWSDANPLVDLDNFAAQIAALDLVISIDNSTVHMAGALGVPVWTMLPWVPDWRWGIRDNSSSWYPSMRLFRQPRPDAWDDVIRQVTSELTLFCNERR